jgi:hypothetical protein
MLAVIQLTYICICRLEIIDTVIGLVNLEGMSSRSNIATASTRHMVESEQPAVRASRRLANARRLEVTCVDPEPPATDTRTSASADATAMVHQ